MLRFIVSILLLGIFFLITLPFLGILFIVRLFSRRTASIIALAFVRPLFYIIEGVTGTKVKVKGKERIPQKEAVLYVLNHRSYFDIILTYPRVAGPTGYVAKNGLENVPFLSWWMRVLSCDFMDRQDIKKGLQTIVRSAERIQKGISIAICPEGTRNKTADPLLPFKGGALKIAEKAGCKIVPVVCNGTDDVWEKQYPKMKPAKVIIEYLPPIDVGAMDKAAKKGLTDMVYAQMQECYLRNEKERLG